MQYQRYILLLSIILYAAICDFASFSLQCAVCLFYCCNDVVLRCYIVIVVSTDIDDDKGVFFYAFSFFAETLRYLAKFMQEIKEIKRNRIKSTYLYLQRQFNLTLILYFLDHIRVFFISFNFLYLSSLYFSILA